MPQQDNIHYAGYDVFNGLAPKKGPRILPIALDFSIANPLNIDLTIAQELDRLEWVQGIYIDNRDNPNSIIFTFSVSNQVIKIPAGNEGYVPVLCPNSPKFTVSTSGTTNPTVNILLLSFPVPLHIWQSHQGSTGTDYSANKPSIAANLLITVPVNGKRAQIEIQNQSAETIQVVLDDGNGNNISILLLAPNSSGANLQGASWTNTTFKGRIRVYGATSSDQVYAHED